MNPGYPIEVFWSDEDGVWIADAPDLPMCCAHGPVPHEAVAEVEQAMRRGWTQRGPRVGQFRSRPAEPP